MNGSTDTYFEAMSSGEPFVTYGAIVWDTGVQRRISTR